MCSVAQSHLTLHNPMDCSPPGSSVHGIFQTRILEWVAISSSRGSSHPKDGTRVPLISSIGRQILYHCITREVPESPHMIVIHISIKATVLYQTEHLMCLTRIFHGPERMQQYICRGESEMQRGFYLWSWFKIGNNTVSHAA